MDGQAMRIPNNFRIADPLYGQLMHHLFPGDGDEHGAVVAASVSRSPRETRYLAREIFLAKDGVDYVPGRSGYRALTAEFVARVSHRCSSENLGYFAVHCHGGTDTVSFSPTDLQSHQRGYPALLDIMNGQPVGALVFAKDAVAGHIWDRGGVTELNDLTVIGFNHRRLFPSSQRRSARPDSRYHRQSLLFGSVGQELLRNTKVGIVGLGGAGSLVNEWMARLGVGEIVAIDPEKLEPTNLPRVVGATRWDAQEYLSNHRWKWFQSIGHQLAAYKVHVARRVARQANRHVRYTPIVRDITSMDAAHAIKDADFIFLCADSAQARLVFNALVHQYLIPGFQVGAKVPVNKSDGTVGDVFVASRPVFPYPSGGCLDCNQLIPSSQLQDEAISPEERRQKGYVDDPSVHAPSVITLNALACAQAANDFLFGYLGLFHDNRDERYLLEFCRERRWRPGDRAHLPNCLHCALTRQSIYARGDGVTLPCRTPS
jgi:molybdopterin/thiamine biosynthesis adenylyltransferase